MRHFKYILLAALFTVSCVEREATLKPSNNNQQVNANRNAPAANTNQSQTRAAPARRSGEVVKDYKFLKFGRIGEKGYNQTLTSPAVITTAKEVFQVTGWGLQRNPVKPLKELYVKIAGKSYITNYGMASEFLLEYFDNEPGAKNVFFMCAVPTYNLPKGAHDVTLVGVTQGGEELHSEQKGKIIVR